MSPPITLNGAIQLPPVPLRRGRREEVLVAGGRAVVLAGGTAGAVAVGGADVVEDAEVVCDDVGWPVGLVARWGAVPAQHNF